MAHLPAELLRAFGDPSFLDRATDHVARSGTKDDLYHLLRIDEERVLCREVERSGLQDPALVRYRRRAHLLSLALIDEKGNFSREDLESFLNLWEGSGRIFYSSSASDEAAFIQVRNVLTWLTSDSAVKKILKFSLPIANHYLEHLLRVSLFLPNNHVLRHADVRRSVLSACFCLLRQSVGSCFATAPAILIHAQQIEHFLTDLDEILSTSRLKRVVEGEEYAVPSSASWGMGDLKRDLIPLLHAKRLERSPGLMAALESIHISRESLSSILIEGIKDRKNLYVDDFFEELLLRENHLAKERWELFKQGNRFIPKSLLVTQRDPQEALCEQVETALGNAKDMFRAITDHPLLKTWEYTLASFSEVKMEFSRWNLYASLGFDASEVGGLGAVLAASIDKTIEQANKKIEELQTSYEIAFDQVRLTEGMLARASSDQEARRLKAEYVSRSHHMRSLLEMRDEEHRRGAHFVSLYSFLLKQYDKRFPEYFQEIYDAEMFDPSQGADQDSAAGFRLVYKHGRSDPSQWTLIRSGREYIDSLLDFFKMSEPEVIAASTDELVAKEIPRLTDLVIQQLQSDEFLKTALLRMKKAHSTEKLTKQAPEMLVGEKTPWAYISGGTMETLLKTYYRGQSAVHSEGRWVESSEDLLILLLETLKGVSFSNSEILRKNPERRLLMHSPTHAFLLLPGAPRFCEGWEHDSFTYTWVRDHVVEPSKNFYKQIILNRREANFMIDRFGHALPEMFIHEWKKALDPFSSKISIDQFVTAAGPSLVEGLDGLIFSHMPLYEGRTWKESVSRLAADSCYDLDAEIFHLLTSFDLLKLAKGCFLLNRNSLQQRMDLHSAVLESALQQKMIAPRVVFADTNWPHYSFAFAWGAASKRLRLFRIEPDGGSAAPMTSWDQYLNGKNRLSWVIYTKPEQYS